MAEKPDEGECGGYDYGFVGEVSDRFICQICTKVLRDPHLAVCCGQHFCETCLNKWFTNQAQGKESCPHCRAEGEGFNHVINKGLRSEVNQLKIKCSNHGKGCQWTGELGTLKKHLESDNGCGFVKVQCPNKCDAVWPPGIRTMMRKDLKVHLTAGCYLRPYQCKFCGHKDTYEAITGRGLFPCVVGVHNPYGGHQAKCPKAPLTCPNRCGSTNIKRKYMEGHRSQCPKEPVKCPFAEAGCKTELKRSQLSTHMTSNMQEHLSLIMKDYRETKRELRETKEKLQETNRELRETKRELRETKGEVLEVNGALATAVQLLSQETEAG